MELKTIKDKRMRFYLKRLLSAIPAISLHLDKIIPRMILIGQEEKCEFRSYRMNAVPIHLYLKL
jgi:hypothetical protein